MSQVPIVRMDSSNTVVVRSRVNARRYGVVAICVTAGILIAATLTIAHGLWSVRPKGIGRLVEATARLPFRTLPIRLSGGFEYRPIESPDRGAAGARPELWPIYEAVAEVRENDERDVHAIGVAGLLAGNIDHAITALEQTVIAGSGKYDLLEAISASRDAPLLSDLSGAYFVRARSRDRTRDYASALNAAESAFRISPTAEVAWNRALAIEVLHPQGAAEAWTIYLRIEPASEWSREASERRDRMSVASLNDRWKRAQAQLESAAPHIVDAIATEFPEQLRLYLDDTVVPNIAAGNGTFRFETALALADALCRTSEECLTADSLEMIRASDATRRAKEIGDGYRRYAAAQAVASKDPEKREEHLLAAAKTLDAIDYPFAPRVHLQLATLGYDTGRYADGLSHVAIVDRRFVSAKRRSPILEGQLEWVRGLLQISVGEPHEASASYHRAVRTFAEHRAYAGVGGVELLLGENLRYLGDFDEAWDHYRRALSALGRFGESPRLGLALSSAARTAAREGLDGIALLLADASLTMARRQGDAAYETQAAIARCQIASASISAERFEQALNAAEQARNRIPTEAARVRFDVDLQMARASLAARRSPDAGLAAATEAIRIAGLRKDVLRVVRAYALRARLGRSAGRLDPAVADLRAGISELEKQRLHVTAGPLRASFLETANDLYRELADLLETRGDGVGALEVAEAARSRVLLDVLNGKAAAPPPGIVETMTNRLPGGGAVIEYFAVPNAMLAFVISRDEGIRTIRSPWTSANREASKRFRQSRNMADASDLYDVLIRPLNLDRFDHVTFVPDRSIATLPLAMLYDRQRKRFLVEDVVMATAPSATVALQMPATSVPLQSMLIVSEPAMEESLTATLPRLPGASREAATLAARVPSSKVLERGDATPARILEGARSAAVVHFAGHTLDSPFEAPALVCAPDAATRDGLLRVSAIQSETFPRLRLVVLAACNTSVGETTSEGTMSLARAFIAAGANGVVASLWPVTDDAYASFWRVFYEGLARGGTPAEALRHAQLALLRHPRFNSPEFWAGFEFVGSA